MAIQKNDISCHEARREINSPNCSADVRRQTGQRGSGELPGPYGAFSILKLLDCCQGRSRRHVLVVMPLSGHHAALVRDLVLSLAKTHVVSLLDWRDARDVPSKFGPFGFDDQIKAIIAAIDTISQPVHVVGICQSGLPVLTAAAALSGRDRRASVQSLVFLGVPFDPTANPTGLSCTLRTSIRSWIVSIRPGPQVRLVASSRA